MISEASHGSARQGEFSSNKKEKIMGNEFLIIEAALDGGKPKVMGLAYSGGKMRLQGWKQPVVVDLAGMEIPEQVPLLANHENRVASRVGMVSAKIENNTLVIEGEILSQNDQANEIVNQSKEGGDWQLSIHADVIESELVRSSKTVNGREHAPPFYHVSRSLLREISVVAVGADVSSRMKVAASFSIGEEPDDVKAEEAPEKQPEKETENPKEKEKESVKDAPKKEPEKTPETEKEKPGSAASAADVALQAIKDERERVGRIQAICNGEFPEIEKEAVSAGWSVEDASQKVLKAIRDGRPVADVNISVKRKPEGLMQRKTIEAAMCMRVGISGEDLLASYGEEAVETAWKDNDMPLQMLLAECLRMEGVEAPKSFGNETIHAAFSTVSLPGILSNVANKKLLQSYESQPIIATRLCSTGDLSDFKENERFRLTDAGDLQPIGADGEIKEGGLTEEKAVNQLDTYGKKFCLTRKMVINDDLGAFMKVPVAMGNRAARLIDQLFFGRLMSNPTQTDTNALFSEAHKNLLSGADSVLAHEGLRKAVQLFLDQVDADGQPINIEPRFLLVPTALKHTAIELTKGATLIMAGGDTQAIRPALNVLADENLQVVSAPHLANEKYEGYSSTAWYLFGNPSQIDTFEIGYLKGKRTPTVERGDTDFNTLGLWFRVYFDLGVREQDFRGMVKSSGQ
jgi:hypothetical protein